MITDNKLSILRHKHDVRTYSLYEQAREEAKAKMGLADVPEKSLTVLRPFNLTKPSLRKVPEPMKIEQVGHK